MPERKGLFPPADSIVGKVVITPEADVVEREDGMHVYCNVPGVSEESIRLEVEDGVLHLYAETALGTLPSGRVHALEFDDAIYAMHLELGSGIEKHAVSASLRHGVLHIVLPFTPHEGPRRIPVNEE